VEPGQPYPLMAETRADLHDHAVSQTGLRPGCFVTGTDTGVGKTAVTAALARCLADRRISVGVMKPIETGTALQGKGSSDAERLRMAAGVSDPLDLISPYRFADPLAPLAAARRTGGKIELERVMVAFTRLAGLHRVILVEGVGGVLAPLSDQFDTGELVLRMRLPALVIGRAALGGVNHALLTIEALRRRHVPILAVVLNREAADAEVSPDILAELQEKTTAALVRELGGLPLIGPVGHVKNLGHEWQAGLAKLLTDPGIQSLADLVAPPAE